MLTFMIYQRAFQLVSGSSRSSPKIPTTAVKTVVLQSHVLLCDDRRQNTRASKIGSIPAKAHCTVHNCTGIGFFSLYIHWEKAMWEQSYVHVSARESFPRSAHRNISDITVTNWQKGNCFSVSQTWHSRSTLLIEKPSFNESTTRKSSNDLRLEEV